MKRTALFVVLALLSVAPPAQAEIEVDGRSIEVIDPHLHPASFGRIPEGGRDFILEGLPPFARLYAPALINRLLDPYSPHVGIRAQTEWGGVDHAVLFAVYTQRTSGYFENAALHGLLTDPDNMQGGEPWATGMVSIDFADWEEPGVPERRLEALESWLEAHPSRYVGIKLAHAHQAVRFDDEDYFGVYDVAARRGVPVLLHTGFSPFPGSQTEPEYYDPQYLAPVIESYDGEHEAPRVDFVLSHVGQGDARATESALDLAEENEHVWLEISALDRPLTIDADGESVSTTDPQYPRILEEIRARGLTSRTLFATDGPQFSGMVRRYVETMVDGMRTAGYTTDEIEAVMGGNARRLFFDR